MRWLVAVALCAGCNSIFGIQKTNLQDAYIPDIQLPDAPDGDMDGIPNAEDNCPMMANKDQADYDGDGAGDVCDTCPHIANNQADDFDGDLVGDDCDPHPTTTGDCLLRFDSFDSQAALANWTIVSDPADTPDLQVIAPHQLVITPHPPYLTALEANGIVGADALGIIGHQNPNGLGSFNFPLVASSIDRADVKNGLDCWLFSSSVRAEIDASKYLDIPLNGEPIRDRYALLGTFDVASGAVNITCRVDWGLAHALGSYSNSDPGYTGGAAIVAQQMPTNIEAVAVYGLAGNPACHVITR